MSEGSKKKQFVACLRDFSSQYGSESSISYVASNIIGEPKLYPEYGDFTQACVLRTYGPWWKSAPGSARPANSQEADDYLEVEFGQKVYVESIVVYETYNPGAVVRILARDDNPTSTKNTWFVMWQVENGHPPLVPQESRLFSPKLKPPPFPTKIIRLEFRHDNLDYYTELDAIELMGTTDVDVDALGFSAEIDNRMSELSLSPPSNLELSSRQSITSDNGYFDSLPSELILHIFSYLTLKELSAVATVSQLFYQCSYSPTYECHQNLNLKPYWESIDENAMDGFVKKCRSIRSLALAWCGITADLFRTKSTHSLILPSLTALDLSCCHISDDDLTALLKKCAECHSFEDLDLSSTINTISPYPLMHITELKKLKRLNLYRTTVNSCVMIEIAQSCSRLESLNLGSCDYIDKYDIVVASLSDHCKSLQVLDLWRAKSLTGSGLKALALGCPNLISLDIGWCSRVTYRDDKGISIIELIASKCPNLQKLFLTANRSVAEEDLMALAKHCPNLQQLDLLGNNQVTAKGVNTLLKSCKALRFLDISFCSQIDNDVFAEFKSRYPSCVIKKSYTS